MSVTARSSRICQPDELPAEDALHWHRLWQDSPSPSPFMSFGFARAAARAGCNVRVMVVRCEARPVAFFAFQFASRFHEFIRAGERVGSDMSDYCGVIAEPGWRITPGELLACAGLASFSFSHLHPAQPALGLSGEKGESGLAARFSGSGTEYWNERCRLSPKLGTDTSRCARNIERDVGRLRFEFDASQEPGLLERLIDLKRAQYASTSAHDALGPEWRRRLLAQLLALPHDGCRGVLSVLKAGDEIVALHLGLLGGAVLHYWFPVYRKEYSKYSPGRLLYRCFLDQAEQHGYNVVDNGVGLAEYKAQISNERYETQAGRWDTREPAALVNALVSSLKWRMQALSRFGRRHSNATK
jgi:CelD/BcsL family acetyltransferase involved in cellulose biosynthesis